MRSIEQFIDGAVLPSSSGEFGDVYDPDNGIVQARVGFAAESDLEKAVAAARAVQPSWAATNPQRRARVMFRFKALIETHYDELAALLSSEHGKLVADARGDIQRGLDVVEFACGIPHLQKGEYSEGAGPGIDVYSMRQPLGVCAGITPFNFPAMIPMWMFSVAIACGNTFILKPSEKAPSVPMRLAELFLEAGAPPGVLNVVNGSRSTVEAILRHPEIRAVSFVGSSDVAQQVYSLGTAHGKRVQAMGGAKNHGVILPDANMDQAVNDIIGAAFGSAGERCMAVPVAVVVGEETAERFIAKVLDAARALRVGLSTDANAHYGPLISAAHKRKVEEYIDMGIAEGATLLLDGRDLKVPGHENGFFLGPTVFDHVTTDMRSYQAEIFGPVLQIVRADSLEEAAAITSRHQYGNGVAIFTSSGGAARDFAQRVEVGMVGINVPIPVPVSYHSFGGWKRSAFGDMNQHGPEGVRFWTRVKTVTQRWPDDEAGDPAFFMPTMK